MPRPSGPGTQQNSLTPFPGLPFLAAMVAPGPTAAAPTSGATLEKVSKSSLKSANRSSQKKCMDRELLETKHHRHQHQVLQIPQPGKYRSIQEETYQIQQNFT